MSRDDFERCTPFEFYEAWSRWGQQHRDKERADWERTRMMGMFFIQPYVKGKLTAHDVLPFPWDEDENLTKVRNPASRKIGLTLSVEVGRCLGGVLEGILEGVSCCRVTMGRLGTLEH